MLMLPMLSLVVVFCMANKNSANRKTVLVTGGGGFIGSHLVDILVRKGYQTHSIDNYISTGEKLLPSRKNASAKYTKCDIRNLSLLRKHIKRIRPDIIFHTAALARIQPSIKDPVSYEEVNSGGTLKLLLAAREAGVRRVVYSASSSAYGLNKIPLLESMTPDPLNPYAKTKLDGEQWMKIFALLYGIETVSLRYFNVYGPGNIFNGPYTTVITLFLHNYKHGAPMQIVGDGKQTRDYTHVSDVVNANILASQSKKVGNGEVINIGGESPHSVSKIAEEIGGASIRELLKNKKIIFVPARIGESRHTKANIEKTTTLLGWKPKVSFSEGIAKLQASM